MTLTGFAINNLSRRPARTLLTILGIALAIGTAVALLALGRGISDSIARGLDEYGAELIVSPRNSTDVMNARLPESIADEIAAMDGVAGAEGQLFVFGLAGDNQQILTLAWPARSAVWGKIPLKAGRLPEAGRAEILIGDVLAESLGLKAGDTMMLFDETFTVSGITSYATAMNRGMAIMTLTALQQAAFREGQVSVISIRLDPALDDAAAKAVETAIAARFPVIVSATKEVLESDRNIKVLHAVSTAISGVALLMGALNLLGTLLMSVQERTREIGMLTAIGWKASQVVRLIMLEGLLIGLAGCISGLGVGLLASRFFGALPAIGNFISFSPQAGDLLLPLLLALPLCVLGAVYPAWRAVRMLPAEALRHG